MARKFIETELGIEIQCSCCKEFYPADTEFFYKQAGQHRSKWGLHSWCKACYEANASQKAKRQRWKEKMRKSAVERSANSVKQGEVCQA